MELYEIVMKLVGPVQPVGDTNIDSDRLVNLEKLMRLTNQMLNLLDDLASDADSSMASLNSSGQRAKTFLSLRRFIAGDDL